MYHAKIDRAAAIPVSSMKLDAITVRQPVDRAARVYAVLIVVALPLIALWLLARFAWHDAKAIARGVAIFYRAAAEEFSRS